MALIYLMKGERKGIRKFNISYRTDGRIRTYKSISSFLTMGIEPILSQLFASRVCQIPPHLLERVVGIEPTSEAWKAAILTVIRYPHKIAMFLMSRTGVRVSYLWHMTSCSA